MHRGIVHSIQSLGTLDGPGVRFVVFLKGCNLRCGYCHNPDTRDKEGGTEYTAEALLGKAVKYREYFGECGGVTVSGGEPLLQAEFVREFFALCHREGIHTCLDTSGSVLSEDSRALLEETDRVLLDIKFTVDALYKKHTGISIEAPLQFLSYLAEIGMPTTLRQVIVPSLNDTCENIEALAAICRAHPCIDKTELLPFRKICKVKYEKLGIPFPFADFPTPTAEEMQSLEKMLAEFLA